MAEHGKTVRKRLQSAVTYRYIIYIVMFLYTIMPLWMVSAKQVCLIGAVILQSMLFAVTWWSREFRVLKPEHTVEYVLYGIGCFGIIGILCYCFGIDIGYQTGYETELECLLFFLIYLTIKCKPEFDKNYPNVILAGFMVLQIIYLTYALVWPEMNGMPGNFVRNKESVAACAMLGMLIAGIRYAYCKKRQETMLYAVSAAVSAAALAINRDILSLYMTAFLLLAAGTFFTPEPEAVKRIFQVLGGYLFLICNMPLLTEYTKLIQIECSGYLLESSVVLELLLCVFLCYIMSIWERLSGAYMQELQPSERHTETVRILQKLQKSCRRLLCILGMALIGLLITGDSLGQLPDGMICQSIKTEGMVFVRSVRAVSTSNAFYISVRTYGAIGLVIVLILWSAMIDRIRKRYKPVLPERILLKVVAILILVLCGIRMKGITVYGICMWLLVYAIVPGVKFNNGKKSHSEDGVDNRNETVKEAKTEHENMPMQCGNLHNGNNDDIRMYED